MNPLVVVFILFSGMVATALVGAVGWFCWRLLGAMGRLEAALAGGVANQRDFTAELRGFAMQVSDAKAAVAGLDLEAQKIVPEIRGAVTTISGIQREVINHGEALHELAAERDTFRAILGGLKDLDNGIKTFLALAVNTQVPGAMPSDLVKGTALDTTGRHYGYDEAEMAQQEAMRRKARGEDRELAPEERAADGDRA